MIQIAFLWHMHQPLYVDPVTGESVLPWVRLHATRAYYDMIRVAADYPGVHVTFNLVPVLLKQIELLVAGGGDRFRALAEKPADGLTEAEARFLIDQFFQADWGTLVHPNRGYRRLLDLRGGAHVRSDALSRFKVQDLRDLQVWFNLAWFGFTALREFDGLAALQQKQHGFSEQDKQVIFAAQDEILSQIITLYAQAGREGHVELTTTPFYHPILPLVCNTDAAHRALPHIPLPTPAFRQPDDALAQVVRAMDHHRQTFGTAPRGMWPSEGSVSPEVAEILERAGLSWFATSEGILHHSSLDERSHPFRDPNGRPSVLTPYKVGGLAAFFRHLELSDLIGFTYARMGGRDAAQDLLRRCRQAASGFHAADRRPPLTPIILDGENPWEHYRDGGEGFLRSLYEGILEADDLEGVTFSEHIDRHPPTTRIKHLWSGSWIGSTYSIWIGHAEDVDGWQRLGEARRFLSQAEKATPPPSPEALESARESLYAAEGSDWFWWYGEEFSSDSDHEFDRLFRAHLSSVYERLGAKPPANLAIPIKGLRRRHPLPMPRAVVRPTIDGRRTTPYEWADAGDMPLQTGGGAMARGAELVRKLGYGFDEHAIYIRLDFGGDARALRKQGYELQLLVIAPRPLVVRAPLDMGAPTSLKATLMTEGETGGVAGRASAHVVEPGHGGRPVAGDALSQSILVAIDDVLELALPRSLVQLTGGGRLDFFLSLHADREELARFPAREVFELQVPSWDRMTDLWSV